MRRFCGRICRLSRAQTTVSLARVIRSRSQYISYAVRAVINLESNNSQLAERGGGFRTTKRLQSRQIHTWLGPIRRTWGRSVFAPGFPDKSLANKTKCISLCSPLVILSELHFTLENAWLAPVIRSPYRQLSGGKCDCLGNGEWHGENDSARSHLFTVGPCAARRAEETHSADSSLTALITVASVKRLADSSNRKFFSFAILLDVSNARENEEKSISVRRTRKYRRALLSRRSLPDETMAPGCF